MNGPRLAHQYSTWQALQKHCAAEADVTLSQRFARDPKRGQRLALTAAGLYLDYSKNHIADDTVNLLTALAEQAGLPAAIEALFTGAEVNNTERRAALHTALRDPARDDAGVAPQVQEALARSYRFADRIRNRQQLGSDGAALTDIVNIGIGGSEFGPRLVVESLRDWHDSSIAVHFIASLDAAELRDLLSQLDPRRTLFIVSSKSFATLETLTCADTAIGWLRDHGIEGEQLAQHLAAVTANGDKARQLGVATDNIFPIWDWVGGRFSVWSAIGLPAMIAIGPQRFQQFLDGARAMDQHFRSAPLAANMPVLMALLGIWHQNFRGASSHVLLPYCYRLKALPHYLQQLTMESLGKSVSTAGAPLPYHSGQVLWGSAGTNGQHSFHQLLLQGTKSFATDFIAVVKQPGPAEHQQNLLANCLAQSRALMLGQHREQLRDQAAALIPHKLITGNQPSNTLLLPSLNPHSLGALLALYEHKVYTQSVIWGINAFDQWGVELGKQLSKQVYAAIQRPELAAEFDSSTAQLLSQLAE